MDIAEIDTGIIAERLLKAYLDALCGDISSHS
jgi:hypothetical protein